VRCLGRTAPDIAIKRPQNMIKSNQSPYWPFRISSG